MEIFITKILRVLKVNMANCTLTLCSLPYFNFKFDFKITATVLKCFNRYTINHCQPSYNLKSEIYFKSSLLKSRKQYTKKLMALGSLQGIKKCTINIKISKNITIVFKIANLSYIWRTCLVKSKKNSE